MVIEDLNGTTIGGRQIVARFGDVRVMLDRFSGTAVGGRIKGLISVEHERLMRGERDPRSAAATIAPLPSARLSASLSSTPTADARRPGLKNPICNCRLPLS
jgi:hypothetical protein